MSAQSVGQIGLDLVVNKKDFNKQMSGVQNLAKKVGKTLAAAFAVKKLVSFGAACIELGSDLQEVQNVVDVTFPSMSKKVDEFAQNAAASFGLSETMAKKFTGTFGAMAKAFGFSESAAYDMSTTLTGLAGDVASFYNITQDEAYTKLKSVFTGETESLKDLGVVMTQTALDSYALANGYGKTTAKMTEAEKVALRYKFVQEQLTGAAGDFMRTSDGWANQVRVLKLQFDSLKATIGQGLINVLTPVIKLVNTLIGRLMTLANAFKTITEAFSGNKSSGTAEAMNATTSAAQEAAKATGAVGDAAVEAEKKMRGLYGFDEVQLVGRDETSGTRTTGAGIAGADFGNIGLDAAVQDADVAGNKFKAFFEELRAEIQPTIDSLGRLKNEGLAKIGDFTWNSLKDFYDGFLVPVGKWTLGKGIPRFIDAINKGINKIDFERINRSLKDLWDKLTPFSQNVGEGLLWLWEEVMIPFGSWVGNEVVPRFIETVSNVLGVANNIIDAVKPGFQWLWNNILQPIAEWTGGAFVSVWDSINEALKVFSDWCTKHTKAIETIAVVVASFAAAWEIVNTAMGIWNAIGTIATAITTGFGAAVAFLTSPITLAVVAIGALIAAGVLLYKNWDTVKTSIIAILTTIKNKFISIFTTIKDTVSGIFEGLWSNIKGVINSILTGIEGMANGVVRGINKVIDALNRLSIDVPDWVTETTGIGTFGFNIPSLQEVQIPKLWNGAYVKANTPQLAMIGDNRHQGEIVAPEDKMYQISAQAMIDVMQQFMSAFAAMLNSSQGREGTLIIKVTGEMAPFVRLLKAELDKEANREGVDYKVVYE